MKKHSQLLGYCLIGFLVSGLFFASCQAQIDNSAGTIKNSNTSTSEKGTPDGKTPSVPTPDKKPEAGTPPSTSPEQNPDGKTPSVPTPDKKPDAGTPPSTPPEQKPDGKTPSLPTPDEKPDENAPPSTPPEKNPDGKTPSLPTPDEKPDESAPPPPTLEDIAKWVGTITVQGSVNKEAKKAHTLKILLDHDDAVGLTADIIDITDQNTLYTCIGERQDTRLTIIGQSDESSDTEPKTLQLTFTDRSNVPGKWTVVPSGTDQITFKNKAEQKELTLYFGQEPISVDVTKNELFNN